MRRPSSAPAALSTQPAGLEIKAGLRRPLPGGREEAMSLLQTFYLSTVVYFALAISFSYLLVRRTRTVDRAETLEALERALRILGKPIDHERLIEIWKRLRRFDEKADRLLKKS